jgi:hypothetical protein
MTADELRGIRRSKDFVKYGRGYFLAQGTTPYTIGAVLAASPISTIAYLCAFFTLLSRDCDKVLDRAEKWYRWSSPKKPPTHDEVLTNILLYWLSDSLTSSFWVRRPPPVWFGSLPHQRTVLCQSRPRGRGRRGPHPHRRHACPDRTLVRQVREPVGEPSQDRDALPRTEIVPPLVRRLALLGARGARTGAPPFFRSGQDPIADALQLAQEMRNHFAQHAL